jgi:hypothetical protein
MTQSAIVAKLATLLGQGIRCEADALYVLVEVRKLLEQQEAKQQYEYLTFYCDWAVHARLTGPVAQEILARFDAANVQLKQQIALRELPEPLRTDLDRISKMKFFENEMDGFLGANGLPNIESTRVDGWIHFLHLYGKIVEDCPLLMTATNQTATIKNVTLKLDFAEREGEMWFKVRWIIEDKNGGSGEIYVLNSFRVDPGERHPEVIESDH